MVAVTIATYFSTLNCGHGIIRGDRGSFVEYVNGSVVTATK